MLAFQSLCVAVVFGFGTAAPASAQLLQIAHQSWDEIAHASGTDALHSHMNNPRAVSFDVQDGSGNIVKKVLVNWQANRDYAPWPYYHGWMGSGGGVPVGDVAPFDDISIN